LGDEEISLSVATGLKVGVSLTTFVVLEFVICGLFVI
jgi:hypothetical protein